MYVASNEVFVQDRLLFYGQRAEPFSVQKAFLFLPDRRMTNEEGKKVSQWLVALHEVEEFVRALSL
jgi:hypothetical protein